MKHGQPKRTVNTLKHALMGSRGTGQAVGDVEAETARMRIGKAILVAPPCAGCGQVDAGFTELTSETSTIADDGWFIEQPSRRSTISREGIAEESECPIVAEKPGNSGGAKGVTGPNNRSVRECDDMRRVNARQD
jgi:hypothetical protein